MAIEKIAMPQLGESVHEGTVNKWFVSAGDVIEKYAPLVEIMTDKVTAEVPASFSGKIHEILVQEGETVTVGSALCTIETAGRKTAVQKALPPEQEKVEHEPDLKNRFSPAVLKLAREHEIDLSKITGTGLGGRITRKDVLAFIENGKKAEQPEKAQKRKETFIAVPPKARSRSYDAAARNKETRIPVTGIRKAIAANMSRSKQEIPHAWMMMEADVTGLVKYRNSIKEEFKKKEGFPLTYFPFFVKAVSQALKEFPQMNSTWQGEHIILKNEINISIAVSTEDALYVPVIKNADEKSIKGLAREMHELAEKARNGKLTLEDTEGGTFTVNNTGTFGSVQSMGIINYPQAAILQVEKIVQKPVAIDGMLAFRDMVNLCLSIDHRVVDGWISGKFLNKIKQALEQMSEKTITLY